MNTSDFRVVASLQGLSVFFLGLMLWIGFDTEHKHILHVLVAVSVAFQVFTMFGVFVLMTSDPEVKKTNPPRPV